MIAQGNQHRAERRYAEALRCYAQVFTEDPDNTSAWNNYGNVTREMGRPDRAIPFLEHCLRLDPQHVTAQFNLAVAYLLMGDYGRGWPAYEARWNYEHLAGTLPNLPRPRWTGQDIKDKTLLLIGEQGLGDTIQFVRFALDIAKRGGKVVLVVPDGCKPLFGVRPPIMATVGFGEDLPEYDYWVPMMSVPALLELTLEKMVAPLSYISPNPEISAQWGQRLGPKRQLRVGFSWSGRRDTWINQHKSVPLPFMLDLIKRQPQHQWVNLQVDCSAEEDQQLADLGVVRYPGTIQTMADTAGLINHLDVVISVDTSVSHLAGAMGRPTWVMLNKFATDWRWLLNRDDSPWYPSARLFRQQEFDDWAPVIDRMARFLDLFKI